MVWRIHARPSHPGEFSMPSSTRRPHRGPQRARRYLLPTLFAALVGVFALTGCGLSVSSDPLVAARVNGHAISLSAYEDLVRFNRANAALQATAPDWQSPTGRSQLYPMEKDALSTLTNLQMMRDALAAQKISVPASEIKKAHDELNGGRDSLKEQLKSQPNNTALRNMIDALTPDTVDILAEKIAVLNTLAKAPVFPSANVRGILVANASEADDLLAQVKNGADFGQLAKSHSLDTSSAPNGGDLGRVYVGELNDDFNSKAFGPNATNEKYFDMPYGNSFAVFEVTDRKPAALPDGISSQGQQATIAAWMSTLPKPKVEQYITIG
jgi:parvulin-like peptidyl-prolyl cis-trans isomerase-like protein/SurA-like protein